MEGFCLSIGSTLVSGGGMVIVSGGTTVQVALEGTSGAVMYCSGSALNGSLYVSNTDSNFTGAGVAPNGIHPFSGASISSGASTYSGSIVNINSMSFTPSGGVVINTTLPEDAETAYADYITDKRLALNNGGVAFFNGTYQRFSGGYAGSGGITEKCLMSLNGVHGYADKASKRCDLTIAPSVGVWAEAITVNGSAATLLRALAPCITCEDYNNIFATEMVLYHATNNVAWRLMNTGVGNDGATPPGTWYRYQGLLAYWSFLTYSDAFLNYTCTVRENLAVNLGYANPVCDNVDFVCVSLVSCTDPVTTMTLMNQNIFYPGNMIYPGTGKDNNTYTSGDPIPFIIAYNQQNLASGGMLYCGGASGSALVPMVKNATVKIGGTDYALSSLISGAQQITNIQSFTYRSAGGWILGLAGSNLGGQQYAAQPYTLGGAGGSVSYQIDAVNLDTYSVYTQWWVGSSGGTLSAYSKPGATTFKTYSLVPLTT